MAEDTIDLGERFPDMEPIRSAPSLGSLNGFGTTVIGRRDEDPETGTYVKTHCITALFIPVIATRAYRVADGEDGGWYFLGRVPLSGTAKLCNLLVLLGILSLAGRLWWSSHTKTDEYRAGQFVAEAEAFAEDGKLGAAARRYRRALGLVPGMEAVRDGMRDLCSRKKPLAEVAEAYDVAVAMHLTDKFVVHEDLAERAFAIVAETGRDDPAGGLDLLDAVAPVTEAANVNEHAAPLAAAWVAREPDSVDAAVRLAGVHERGGAWDKIIPLLARFETRLGTTEGARLLGQALVGNGEYARALPLLERYTDDRVTALKSVSRALDDRIERIWNEQIQALDDGDAPDSFYRRYEAGNDAVKQRLVQEHIQPFIDKDAQVRELRQEYADSMSVVSTVLDLGVARLRHARSLSDPAARKAGLEAAERTFLSINAEAGEGDAYLQSLAQVFAWLGKHDQSRAQLDKLLAKHDRSANALLTVAHTYREIGAHDEGRKFAEEAYEKGDPDVRRAAAATLAVAANEADEELKWLRRADGNDPFVKARLATALGRKAMLDGDDGEAEKHLKEAVAAFASMPESSFSCNGAGVTYLSLYEATGDPAHLDGSLRMTRRAVALSPGDSVLQRNLADDLARSAVRATIGNTYDLGALRIFAGADCLRYAYTNATEKRALAAKLESHPHYPEALDRLERFQLLAPRNADGYAIALGLRLFVADEAGVRALRDRLRAAPLDHGPMEKTLRLDKGRYTPEERKQVAESVERARARHAACSGPTRALASSLLADSIVDSRVAVEADLDEAVRLAEAGRKGAPSSYTRSILRHALAARILRDVREAVPARKDDVTVGSRTLGPLTCVAAILVGGGDLAAAVRAAPDFERVRSLVLESERAFPDEPHPAWYPFLDAESRPAFRERCRVNRLVGLELEASAALAPYSVSTALNLAWLYEFVGRSNDARAVLDACRKHGLLMPFTAIPTLK